MEKNAKDMDGLNGQNKEKDVLKSLSYIREKSEKLCRVFYIITKDVSVNEPLRNEVRQAGIELMSFSVNVLDNSWGVFDRVSQKLSLKRNLLAPMMGLLADGGYLSLASAEALVREIEELVRYAQMKALAEQGEILGAISRHGEVLSLESRPKHGSSLSGFDVEGKISSSPKREQILALFKVGVRYSIKEVARGVVGYSEKTVQRELSALVSDGILDKKGERRWSTYARVNGR